MSREANEIPDSAIVTTDAAPERDPGSLRHIRERYQTMEAFWSRIHDVGLEDDKMVNGQHWPPAIKADRDLDGRPCLTYNLIPSMNRQITNRMRQERTSVKVTPVETNRGADPRMKNVVGTKDYSMGDIYAGVIRNIEHISRADQAYDTAAKHAVDHGFGYFYMLPRWSKVNPFTQELVIKRVKNSYRIMLDPEAEEADYRDMEDAFMITNMRKGAFERKYPGKNVTAFEGNTTGMAYDGWYDRDSIRIAQYFHLDHRQDEALMLSSGKIVYRKDVEPVLDELEKQFGIHIAKDDNGKEMIKAVKRPICVWQKMSGDDILEGPLDLPFSAIPIFPVLGEEQLVDGETFHESAHHQAHDAQRSYNYWRTAAAETVALAPKVPWIIADKQLKGHEDLWDNANNRNLPYLSFKHIEGYPIPSRNFPTGAAAAELANASHDGQDMQTIIGLHDASLGREGNEKSGKAIHARQQQGTTATFQFPDNLGRAQVQMGRCAVEAIPRIMDTKQLMRIRNPDDSTDFVEINQAVNDEESGQTLLIHDIAYGLYDVALETGASYATLRQEASDLQMEMLKILGPQAAQNIVHLIVKNLGIPGSDEIARVLRKMLPDALKTEEEKLDDLPKGVTKNAESGALEDEDGNPYEPPLSPEMQAQMKIAKIEELKAQAEMETAEAKKAGAAADIKQAEAKTARAAADLKQAEKEMAALGQEGPGAEQMGQIQEIISQTMKEHALEEGAHNIQDQIAEAIYDALRRVSGYVDRSVGNGEIVPVGNGSNAVGAKVDSTDDKPATGGQTINLKLGPITQEAARPDRVHIQPDGAGGMIATPEFTDNPEDAD